MKTKIFLTLFCALLAACATAPAPKPAPEPAEKPIPLIALRPAPDVPNVPDAPEEINALLAYHQWLRGLTPAELAKELAVLNAQPKNAQFAQSALKKSMLLASNHDNDDLARAQALIDGIVKSPEPDALRIKPLARMLAANYAEMHRLGEQVDKVNQQAKDSQRRTEQLNEKLEALKAIERTLPARPSGTAAVPLMKAAP
ncbi:MAG: hypothetical protein ABIO19_00910 [Burkholderiaceae bacterium]